MSNLYWFSHNGRSFVHSYNIDNDSTTVAESVNGQMVPIIAFDVHTRATLPAAEGGKPAQIGQLILMDNKWVFRHLDRSTTTCCVEGYQGLRQSEIMIAKLVIDDKIKRPDGSAV